MTDEIKDDLATQEMMAMMGELDADDGAAPQAPAPDPIDAATAAPEDIDALLDELEEIDATAPEEAVELEPSGSAEETETPENNMEPPLEEVLKEIEAPSEDSDPEKVDETKAEAPIEPEEVEEAEPSETMESVEEETPPDSTPIEPVAPDSTLDIAAKPSSTPEITPSQAVKELEEAIAIRDELKQLASTIHQHTHQTTQLAIASAKKAQEEAEQLQQEIDQALQASEKAMEILQKAGYSAENLPQVPNEALPDFFAEVHAKNEQLKKQNEALKSRLGSE